MKQKNEIPEVIDFMNTNVFTVSPDMLLYDATRALIDRGLSFAPVVEERYGQKILAGSLSEQDCLDFISNELYHRAPDLHVANLMRHQPLTLSPDADILEAAAVFAQNSFRDIPVVKNKILLGIVCRRDVLSALYSQECEPVEASRKKTTSGSISR